LFPKPFSWKKLIKIPDPPPKRFSDLIEEMDATDETINELILDIKENKIPPEEMDQAMKYLADLQYDKKKFMEEVDAMAKVINTENPDIITPDPPRYSGDPEYAELPGIPVQRINSIWYRVAKARFRPDLNSIIGGGGLYGSMRASDEARTRERQEQEMGRMGKGMEAFGYMVDPAGSAMQGAIMRMMKEPRVPGTPVFSNIHREY